MIERDGRWQRRLRGLPRSLREVERSLQLLGSLRELGWQRSIREGIAVDAAGSAVPWITYPALTWLAARVLPAHRVFEYGCGASTLWFASRVREVMGVEHNRDWAELVDEHTGENVIVTCVPSSDEVGMLEQPSLYAEAILNTPSGFDVVVIDGMDRNGCVWPSIRGLNDEGIIVFDNSHRAPYRPGVECLRHIGFWQIDFYGFCPGYGTLAATSIFGRTEDPWLRTSAPLPDTGW